MESKDRAARPSTLQADWALFLDAVSVKLPTFWTAGPRVWFQQAEAQFQLRGITADGTRYYCLVGALDQVMAREVTQFLADPPATDKYLGLKELLLQIYGLSRMERAARLLHMEGLGDRRPSRQTPCLMHLPASAAGLHPPATHRRLLRRHRGPSVGAPTSCGWRARMTPARWPSLRHHPISSGGTVELCGRSDSCAKEACAIAPPPPPPAAVAGTTPAVQHQQAPNATNRRR
ncbi:uncharacterized protein LOC129700058 [Leucoraja erinacea]|uniref:uncharacterized protein LOC129700058 n=1 Tax=Leucoraja erinaceus TaxID=7782 RepID=UPI002456E6FD|nr:uncharacterized protein LOC129700058 [Leucoraja erinacea]XP_055496209.1 uncharacterized protein LOC129700058 [Leucoraja erinacea]